MVVVNALWWFAVTLIVDAQAGRISKEFTLVCMSKQVIARDRDDYVYTPGIGAHKFHDVESTWNIARRTCIAEGAHLAVINSKAEADKLMKLFDAHRTERSNDDDLVWLGFHDLFANGERFTVHGDLLERSGYMVMSPGTPAPQPDQHCGTMTRRGELHDHMCSQRIAFFCEIPYNVLSAECSRN